MSSRIKAVDVVTMSQERIAALEAMTEAQPDQEMIWYGLANEYVKLARWPDAVAALRRVISLTENYTAAYQMLGTALFNSGEVEKAREAWSKGLEAADRTGAWKARQHIQNLLSDTASAAVTNQLCDDPPE